MCTKLLSKYWRWDNLGDPHVDGMIILKITLREENNKVLDVLQCLRMEASAGKWRKEVMNLTVSSKVGNFYSAFLILSNINFVHTIFEISVAVSQKISASLLHGSYVMEIIAIYCEVRVAHIHTLWLRVQLLHVRASGACSRHCSLKGYASLIVPGQLTFWAFCINLLMSTDKWPLKLPNIFLRIKDNGLPECNALQYIS